MKKIFAKKDKWLGAKIGAAALAVALVVGATVYSGSIRNLHGEEIVSFGDRLSSIQPAAGEGAPASEKLPVPDEPSPGVVSTTVPEPAAPVDPNISAEPAPSEPMSEPMGEPGVSSGSSDGLVVDEDELEQAHNDHPAEEMTCGSYPEWVGQKVDRAAIEATGKPFRVIKPDSMVTMDHNPDRINVVIDDNEIVLEVKCG